MARPEKKLTEEQIIQVESLASVLTSGQMADYFGIGRSTFYEIMERDTEVAGRYKKGRSKAIAMVANGLLKDALAGDNVLRMFYLKTQAGWREKDRDNTDSQEALINALSSLANRLSV